MTGPLLCVLVFLMIHHKCLISLKQLQKSKKKTTTTLEPLQKCDNEQHESNNKFYGISIMSHYFVEIIIFCLSIEHFLTI